MTVVNRKQDWLIPAAEFAARKNDYAFRHGTMRMMHYTPEMPDNQAPHQQDEFYIVISGTGSFTKRGETRSFGPGDAIFVEAGADHSFDVISDDMLVWVLFWGPPGGE